ncbi:sulfatase [Flavobacteriaceae bacterium F89]|uniref:Sulfatase n=1 Tax=Cerina litoralis TaxID=2874477 RepID=A0AAE3EUW5_9FLAO|nr:sulfatase [Cerina litoralis]MCG2460181.1 sulfatase [Cerina litoralis]
MKTPFTALLVLLVTFTSINASTAQTGNKKSNRPNILYIMSDDHGYQAVSAYGHQGLNKTPNIDRIAHNGAIFSRAFVTNSLCAPSRAVMLTGKHSFVNGKVDNVQKFNWDQESFPKLLRKNGYQTALIGKIHLDGLPQGFDYSAVLPGQGDYYNPDFIVNGEKKQIHGYVTEITTDLALDWLKNRDMDKPFCLLYHQKAPHREWLPAPKYYKQYTKMKFREPETLFDDYSGRGTAAKTAEMNILKNMNWSGDSKIYPEIMSALGIEETTNWGIRAFNNNLGRMDDAQRTAWDAVYRPIAEEFEKKYPSMDHEELMHWRYERYMQDYLASIASVDEGVGQVLDYLEENGLEDNTIVVYTSDQGFYLGEHGWFDKRFMYEESLRTPLVMSYPKEIKPGTKIDAMVQNIDFAPTFLDYAGVDIPKDMQGESFRKVVGGENPEWRDAVYYTYYEYPSIHMVKRHYGVRTDRYKLIHFYYDIDEWELYDLEKDPHEMKNVYDDPEYAEVQKNMHGRLTEIRKKYGDSDANDQRFLHAYLEAIKK